LQGAGKGLEPLNRYAGAAMLVRLNGRGGNANRLGDSALREAASFANFEKPTAEIRVWHALVPQNIFRRVPTSADGRGQ
jgi:hypothetical protein